MHYLGLHLRVKAEIKSSFVHINSRMKTEVLFNITILDYKLMCLFLHIISISFFFLFLKLYHGLQHHIFLWGLNFHKLHHVCLNCRLEITMLPDATCGFSTP